MNTNFEQSRRDPLLTEDTFHAKTIDYFEATLNDEELISIISDQTKEKDHRKRVSWSVFGELFEKTILDYSAGKDFVEIQSILHKTLSFYEEHKNNFPEHSLKYWEPDSYQYILWLFSLNTLLGDSSFSLSLIRCVSVSGNDDKLLSILFSRLGIIGFPRGEELIFPKTYQHLFDAIKGDGAYPRKEERQKSIKKYLSAWYKSMKNCYWHDRHKGRFPTFFGYWAFEAALVTVLYDLDDSSYRDMLHYPKDFVDHARNNGVDKLFHTQNIKQRWIVFPNDESPISGRWFDNLSNEVISTVKGERMPGVFENAKGYRHFWVSE
ncbi:PoNi-like cognate immunity protein [Vibrio cholerae]|uniref:PoNi-like cognate immunity protein n=1 Tax=Vibrio cholerae TaxID=666 RepID=UPI0029CAA7B4|nr:PoNe immunity protein domain-containing protein [Vibrio cholerae]EII3727144.1 DUF1911 domain-containing protein [Vibrio cholerae]